MRDQLVLICGHYEGVDDRVLHLVTREVSLGDFVLTGGEIPALALINGVLRLLRGTVAKEDSLKFESFEDGLLDYPQYTRPADFRGLKVPDVLLSGNHAEIARWRREQQIERNSIAPRGFVRSVVAGEGRIRFEDVAVISWIFRDD